MQVNVLWPKALLAKLHVSICNLVRHFNIHISFSVRAPNAAAVVAQQIMQNYSTKMQLKGVFQQKYKMK